MIKMPQIMKMMTNGSAEGVSFLSHALVYLSGTSTFTYGIAKEFSISIWGESLALAIQNAFICMLICIYSGKRYYRAAFVFLLATMFAAFLLLPQLPWSIRYFLSVLSLPLTYSSKIIQIYTNYKNGGTGQLSAISIFMMNFRSSGRLFTYLVETTDMLKITMFLGAGILNLILLGQMLYYNWKEKEIDEEKDKLV